MNLSIYFSSLSGLLGFANSDHAREDLKGRLRLAETRAEELTESLRTVTSSMEQYKAMAQSLEESLDKEKQVQKQTQTIRIANLKICVVYVTKLTNIFLYNIY